MKLAGEIWAGRNLLQMRGKKLKRTVAVLSAAILVSCAAQSRPENGVSTNAEAAAIVSAVKEWVNPYLLRWDIVTEQDGATTYLYAILGKFPSTFSNLQFTFVVDAEARDVVCYGFLPTFVPEARRKAMTEFIFRGEWLYGLSTASIVLDGGGEVRCQAWMPFESFTLQPKETKSRLLGAVLDKLLSFSDGVASVTLGGTPAKVAAGVRRVSAFGDLGWTDEERKKSTKADTKTVMERCFDKDAQITVNQTGNPWMQKLSGSGDGVSVGIINGHFEDVVRDMGGRYDVLPYSLVVRDGMVWNVCTVPDAVPDEAIDKAADWAMQMNERSKCSFFNIDFDTGKMWSHYGLPVSVLPPSDELPPGNLYGARIKVVPVSNVATHSEDLHLAVVKALLRTDDTEGAALASMDALSRQAETVATWLRGHLKDTKWEVSTNGCGKMSVTGVVRGHDPNGDDCSFGFDLDDVGGSLVCRGTLSRAVPEARLAGVKELLFRFESVRNVSLDAVALDKDRTVHCFATVPLLALRDDPSGTIYRLSASVLTSLLDISDAVTRVCREGQKPEEAFKAPGYSPRVVLRLLDTDDDLDDDWDDTYEAEQVIESWFNAFDVKYDRGIESELTVYCRDKGAVGQELQERFVMCGKTVSAQCRLKIDISEDRRRALMDYILSYNATLPTVTLHLAYAAEPGDTLFFQYLMPISVLEARKRNSVAKTHFDRMLDMAHRVALEHSTQIKKVIGNVHDKR